MLILIKRLLISLFLLLLPNLSFALTNFTVTVNKTGEDYGAVSTAEAALDDAGDMTDGTVKCGAWDNQSGSDIADATAVTWDGGTSTGTLIHMTNANGASVGDQYLIDVTGGTLADNDTVYDGTNTFDVAGTPDECALVIELYDDDGDLTGDQTALGGGLTLDADNNLTLTAPSAERHDGIEGGATIHYTTSADNSYILFMSSDYVTVEWLHIILTINTGSRGMASIRSTTNNRSNFYIYNNLIQMIDGGGDNGTGILQTSSSNGTGGMEVYNNIIWDWVCDTGATIDCTCLSFNNDFGQNRVYNNTCFNSDDAWEITNASSMVVSNNLSVDCGNSCYFGSVSSSSTNNACNDDQCVYGATFSTGTITSTSANKLIDSGATFQTDGVEDDSAVWDTTDSCETYVTNVDSETQLTLNDDCFTGTENYSVYKNFFVDPTFENEASDDFHLASTDTKLIDRGADLGTEANVDIDGRDRDSEGDTWDIGADEFVAAATRRVMLIAKVKKLQEIFNGRR